MRSRARPPAHARRIAKAPTRGGCECRGILHTPVGVPVIDFVAGYPGLGAVTYPELVISVP
jgi:hypothetical protein